MYICSIALLLQKREENRLSGRESMKDFVSMNRENTSCSLPSVVKQKIQSLVENEEQSRQRALEKRAEV